MTYTPAKQFSLWPAHPQILPDELLSSWMIRLAHGNGFKVHSFYARHFGRDAQIWTRDIDHHAPHWLIEGLSKHSGTPTEQIQQTVLQAYEGYLFESFSVQNAIRWLLPLGVRHRTRKRFSQQFCPQCLGEDAVPYLRRLWRLSFATVCTAHQVQLLDRCPHCAKALMPHRLDMGARTAFPGPLDLGTCAFCRKALHDVGYRLAPACLVELQKILEKVLARGYAKVDGRPLYSHLYFDGLRVLLRGARSNPEIFAIQTEKLNKVFEHADIDERRLRMQALAGMLREWPERFLDLCRLIKRPYSAFFVVPDEVPYWLHKIARRELFQGIAPIDAAQAEAILEATARATGHRTMAAVTLLTGKRIAEALRAPTMPTSDELAESLLMTIDQTITVSPERERQHLIRDKTMFIAGRVLGLSTERLGAMRCEEIDKRQFAAHPFWDMPKTSAEVGRMLGWYFRKHRPHMLGEKSSPYLFTTAGGNRMSDSSVSARFNGALRRAHLHRSIRGWTAWIRSSPE